MKFKSTLTISDSGIWGLIFPIPKEISDHFRKEKINRFIYNINNNIQINRGMLPAGNGSYFVYINKEIAKKLDITVGHGVSIEMLPDNSEYGMPLPEELAACFALYPAGNKYFHQLTKGKQRTLIYMVAKPKRSQTKINKAIQIFEYLEKFKGKLDFKQLMQWFKDYK